MGGKYMMTIVWVCMVMTLSSCTAELDIASYDRSCLVLDDCRTGRLAPSSCAIMTFNVSESERHQEEFDELDAPYDICHYSEIPVGCYDGVCVVIEEGCSEEAIAEQSCPLNPLGVS